MSRSSTNIRMLARLLGQHKQPFEGAAKSFSTVAEVHLHEKEGKVLHPHLLNENVLKTEYAVRGELYLRAEQLRKEGKEIMFTNGGCRFSQAHETLHERVRPKGTSAHAFPLDILPTAAAVSFLTVGNPHALGAKPMTFTRQVCFDWVASFTHVSRFFQSVMKTGKTRIRRRKEQRR